MRPFCVHGSFPSLAVSAAVSGVPWRIAERKLEQRNLGAPGVVRVRESPGEEMWKEEPGLSGEGGGEEPSPRAAGRKCEARAPVGSAGVEDYDSDSSGRQYTSRRARPLGLNEKKWRVMTSKEG